MFNLPSNALCLVCDASLIGRLADADGGRSSRRLSARERVQRVEHCDRDEQMLFSGHVERHDAVGLDTGFIRHAGWEFAAPRAAPLQLRILIPCRCPVQFGTPFTKRNPIRGIAPPFRQSDRRKKVRRCIGLWPPQRTSVAWRVRTITDNYTIQH